MGKSAITYDGDYKRSFELPRESGLGLKRIHNAAGLDFSILPNGCIFALEHEQEGRRTMLNQVLGSPLGAGIGRILIRVGGAAPCVIEAVGPRAKAKFGAGADRFIWEGKAAGLRHRATLWLHPSQALWLWRIDVENTGDAEAPCDAILVQDLGLGPRGFLLNNEAYASQYIDHTVPHHPRFGPAVMSRQNMAQDGRHPWTAHGCLDGAVSYATDALQLFGPAYRDADEVALGFGASLPGARLQHECACAIIQSPSASLKPGESAAWTFFGLFEPDHAEPTSESDLSRIDAAAEAAKAFAPAGAPLEAPIRSILQDASPLACLDASENERPVRIHEERRGEALLSYFVGDGPQNRHAVLREKDRLVRRRHGNIIRSGGDLLPSDGILCATGWMHGVFASQLTIGNTSFHKLFSVSRDAYNITRASGLRVLAEIDGAWKLLTLPSRFEMGLSDCCWEYRHAGGAILVHVIASGEDPALQCTITIEGAPLRLLVLGHLILGEHDFAHAGRVHIDSAAKRIAFRPDPDWLWGQRYPDAVYHLVTSTPSVIDAIGGDELLYADGVARGMPYAAFRTLPTNEIRFAVVGSMTDAAEAERLAQKYAAGVEPDGILASADAFWRRLIGDAPTWLPPHPVPLPRGERERTELPSPLAGEGGGRLRRAPGEGLQTHGQASEHHLSPSAAGFDTLFPWLAHNALIHLSVPHGLEQYSGAAWGTRDVCQGPIELLLALGHADAAKDILRRVFARQRRSDGDWPQWFFLEPAYAFIQAADAHGDIIVWPLKAVCDYIEATGNTAFLSEPVPWGMGTGAGEAWSSIEEHIEVLLDGVAARFIPGTHLPSYGNGDWNDTLQPADLTFRDCLVSSWTSALLFQQVSRYAAVLRRAGLAEKAERLSRLADAIRDDFNRFLIRDGVVAGYAHFEPEGGAPALLLHPSDSKTGVSYSLIPMTCAIAGGLFTPEQTRRHLELIREHLTFPDGVRLMDKPLPYHGGSERIFRRAESSPFFGREVGLMYVQAHLRYCEALALIGDEELAWEGLQKVSPIAVTEAVANAALRQRNAYFSSSDAAFHDRYEASAEWDRVRTASVPFEGGWRVYSGGPGLFADLLVRRMAGEKRGSEATAPIVADD